MSDNDENDEQLIDKAGETIFKNIYKNCQNEIKDKIITKLLLKIEQQNKKINLLEKENKKIKDNFIYVLKRILSTKDQYSNGISNFSSNRNKLNESRNNGTTYDVYKDHYKINYSIIDPKNKSRIKNDFNSSCDNLSLGGTSEYNQKNDIKEAKAKKYLNELYRNNFFSSTDGTPYSNFINKNISLYEELFPKNNINNYKYNETSSIFESLNNATDDNISSRRNRSTVFRNKINIDAEERHLAKQHVNRTFLNKRNKNSNNIRGSESVSERTNKTNYRKYDKNKNNEIQNYNIKKKLKFIDTISSSKKIKNNNNISLSKRSPYLLNKF